MRKPEDLHPVASSFDVGLIPEGHVLIALDHLPDVALVPLLSAMKRVAVTATRFDRIAAAIGLNAELNGEPSPLATDIKLANLAATTITDELAKRGVNIEELKQRMLDEVKTAINSEGNKL